MNQKDEQAQGSELSEGLGRWRAQRFILTSWKKQQRQIEELRKSLRRIQANAESMLTAMDAIGTPTNADEYINTRWIRTEAVSALDA